MPTRRDDHGLPQTLPRRLARGIRVVLRNDATAYGRSLLATTTSALHRPVGRLDRPTHRANIAAGVPEERRPPSGAD